ncbi:MAG: sigma-54 dependent transcriptional regulator [Spirochaetaceae bacterium]
MNTIFIVDDEQEMCLSLSEILIEMNFHVKYNTDPILALEQILKNPPQFVITDIQMPGKGGLNLLKEIKTANPEIHVIVMTGYPTVDKAVDAMKYGAIDFLSKPIKLPKLLSNIEKYGNLVSTSSTFKPERHSRNRRMIAVYETLEIAAKSNASVIITGESGTGKELIAGLIHSESSRKDKPFIKVNSAALSESLLESELFGHEKGAFTGADRQYQGKFELAHTGTLFLDEIADMSLTTQAKILRVLQEQEFTRLGGTKVIKTDIRFVVATNKNFQKLIESGLFREDLYYRLSVITLELPPLRERKEDIVDLIDFFRIKFCTQYGKVIHGVEQNVIDQLIKHSWPGNIRELKNCMERAVIFCKTENINMGNLSSQYSMIEKVTENSPEILLNTLSKVIIINALKEADGSKQKAADILKIHRKTLYNKMKKLDMM